MIQKSVSVTSKGTFTLPARMRAGLGIKKAGDKLMLTYYEQSKRIEISAAPDIEAVRSKNQAFLKSQGFTLAKLKKIAENYQNGNGMAAYVKEKYGHAD